MAKTKKQTPAESLASLRPALPDSRDANREFGVAVNALNAAMGSLSEATRNAVAAARSEAGQASLLASVDDEVPDDDPVWFNVEEKRGWTALVAEYDAAIEAMEADEPEGD